MTSLRSPLGCAARPLAQPVVLAGLCCALAAVICGCGSSKPKPAPDPPPTPSFNLDPYPSSAASATTKAKPPATPEPGLVPSSCDSKQGEICLPAPAFVQQLCQGPQPNLAFTLFRKGTPWTRAYVRRLEMEAWYASGGHSRPAKLRFAEELIVLATRNAGNGGIQVSGAGSYDPATGAITWTGTVTANQPVTITFRAAVDPAAPDGAAITNTAVIRDSLGRLYDRTAVAKASIPPTIVYTYPADDQIGVPITAPLVITFSEPIDVASWVMAITPDPGLEPSVWSPDLTAVTVHHLPFAYDQRYTVTVAAADLDGRDLVPGFVPNPWSFTTETRPLYRTYLPLVLK